MRQKLFALVAFMALTPAAVMAQPMIQSQEGIALENQILQLQQQMQNNPGGGGGSSLGGSPSAPVDNGGAGAVPSSVITSLLGQVQQLQSQIQDLNGKVDTLQNEVDTQHGATEKEISDLKFQMTNGAAPGATPAAPGAPVLVPPSGPQPSQTAPAPTATAPTAATPKSILKAAQQAILKRDFPAAESSARTILGTAKASPAGYQAQYILGQSLYGEGRNQDAAIAFDDAYNRDRNGAYAPGSLLGLANSLTAIHQEAAACDTLSSLNSQFPSPPKGMAPAIEAASHRAHC